MDAASLKTRLPWPAKIAAKLVLARLPISYRRWSRLQLFRHGSMDVPTYAVDVVLAHLERTGMSRCVSFVALELGPGDSLASAIVADAVGASHTYLVDVARFAVLSVDEYTLVVDELRRRGLSAPDLSTVMSIDELCGRVGASYLTDGLTSLRSIPSASVDIVWSHAVLEHVRAAEFDDVQRELRRVLKPSGIASHRVDLQDHLDLSLNNLRFSDAVWERPLVWNSGFYTNRLRCHEMADSMTRAGFDVTITDVERWSALPVPRQRLAPRFRAMDDDELLVRAFDVIARPILRSP